MAIVYRLSESLSGQERDEILTLLKAADLEFVPPLSSRSGTTQQALSSSETSPEGVTAYFNQMTSQNFVLAENNGKVCGFMSYIPDYELTAGDLNIRCDYISTVIVSKKHRRKGITTAMYKNLFKAFPDHTIATRTWSTNSGHLHILETLGFSLVLTLKNDRGNNIDTVYYVRGPL